MVPDQDELLLDDEKVLLDEEIELLDDEELLFDEDEKLTEDLPDEDAELTEEAEELAAEDEAVEEAVVKTKRPIGKGERMQAFVLDFLTFFFGAVFIICLTEIIFYYAGSYRYRKDIDKLNQAIGGGIATELNYDLLCRNHDIRIFPDEKAHDLVGYVSSFSTEISSEWKEKYNVLVSTNKDCFGFIEIPDTVMSYPVMFTPENYQKYLNLGMNEKFDIRGLPFMDLETKPGRSQNYILYGHNMLDGTSFGVLRDYLKQDFLDTHQYVFFNTALSEGVYQVMYVCRSRIYAKDYKGFKYYKCGGVLTEEQFNTYITEMEKLALLKTGVTATWGDELISLSTCDHYVTNGRLIIVCKRIQ